MAKPFIKRRIPLQSTFTVKVTRTSPAGLIDSSGLFQPPQGGNERWTHNQLTTPPFIVKVLQHASSTSRGDVSIVFTTQATARIEMSVIKPGGTIHGKKYDETFAGQNGELVRVYFSLSTV